MPVTRLTTLMTDNVRLNLQTLRYMDAQGKYIELCSGGNPVQPNVPLVCIGGPQLENLITMRDTGVITSAEFKKAQAILLTELPNSKGLKGHAPAPMHLVLRHVPH